MTPSIKPTPRDELISEIQGGLILTCSRHDAEVFAEIIAKCRGQLLANSLGGPHRSPRPWTFFATEDQWEPNYLAHFLTRHLPLTLHPKGILVREEQLRPWHQTVHPRYRHGYSWFF